MDTVLFTVEIWVNPLLRKVEQKSKLIWFIFYITFLQSYIKLELFSYKIVKRDAFAPLSYEVVKSGKSGIIYI
jgi:hypothetical protein